MRVSSKTAAKSAGKPPVSSHPAFPAIVALWFAALLGIGSLVLPVALIERVSEGSGLPAYLAAAQPPLNLTARVAVALCAAIVGMLAGLAIARAISARDHVPDHASDEAGIMETAVETPAAPVKRPISALDELGEGGFDAAVLEEGLAADEEAPFANAFDATPSDEMPRAENTVEPAQTVFKESVMIEQPSIETDAPARAGGTSGEVALVDLVDRFARALQRHREEVQNETERAVTAKVGPEPEQPAGLAETVSLREEITRGHVGFDAGADEDEHDEDESDDSYPSLLTMKSPFGVPREPVRLDDEHEFDADDPLEESIEPVAIFPGHTDSARSTGNGEAEAALREALEKLQRMSGAA